MDIIVDVDCVVADFVGNVCTYFGEADRSKAAKWDWFDTAYSVEKGKEFREVLKDHNWWRSIPVLEGAQRGIEFLRNNKHNIIWCTAPYESCFGWRDARRDWLNQHFKMKAYNEAFIPTHDKQYVEGLVMIDDKPSHVDNWEKRHREGLGLLFKSELNLNMGRKVVTWEDIINTRLFQCKTRL